MWRDRLPKDVESYVKGKCAGGALKDGHGVMSAAVRGTRTQVRAVRRLAEAIARGFQDGAEGRVTDAAPVFDRLERKYLAMAKGRKE